MVTNCSNRGEQEQKCIVNIVLMFLIIVITIIVYIEVVIPVIVYVIFSLATSTWFVLGKHKFLRKQWSHFFCLVVLKLEQLNKASLCSKSRFGVRFVANKQKLYNYCSSPLQTGTQPTYESYEHNLRSVWASRGFWTKHQRCPCFIAVYNKEPATLQRLSIK